MSKTSKIISIIGGGKLGRSLGRLIEQNKAGTVGGVYNQRIQNAKEACDFIGAGIPCKSLADIPQSDMVFITAPDHAIKSICDQFVQSNSHQNQNNFSVLHCGGSVSSDVLNSAKKILGASVGSVHPIHSFGNPGLAVSLFTGTVCSFEGDKNLYPNIKAFFSRLGASEVFELSAENKAAYHASGMFPGCLTVALMKVAKEFYINAGVPANITDLIIVKLLTNTAKRMSHDGIDGINFDGPLPRDDMDTVARHLEVLEKTPYIDLYKQLMSTLARDIKDPSLTKHLNKILKKKLSSLFSDEVPSDRWENIKRTYKPQDVLRIRGTIHSRQTIAEVTSLHLWELLNAHEPVRALGALTGNQAVQMARAGLSAIYLSGWQAAADGNSTGLLPDRSLYAYDSVPKIVKRINSALSRADQIEHAENNTTSRNWLLPIVADIEAGFGGPLNVFEITKSIIEAGGAGVHLEDQLPSEKKCGHLGGKVLVPVREFINKLVAARLAADVMGTPTIIIGRSDANSAKLIASDIDPVDQPFILNERTKEGYYRYQGGIEASIARALAFAPYCDLIWWETASPNLEEARTLSEAIRKVYPKKMFAYNCSPSFNWRKHLGPQEIAEFQKEMGKLGFQFQFITSAGFHTLNYGMFSLAHNYKKSGMTAFVNLQEKEFSATKKGYTAVYQQKEVANTYYDEILKIIHEGHTETIAMPGSTEEEQFHDVPVISTKKCR